MLAIRPYCVLVGFPPQRPHKSLSNNTLVFTKTPTSKSGSSGRQSHPKNGTDTTGGRGGIRSAFSRRVDVYELDDELHIRSHRSHHSQGEKKLESQAKVAELDSASASDAGGQTVTNRSNEDLVVQRPAPMTRRASSPLQDVGLELGTQSPPRVEVRVEQSYHSSRDPLGAVASNPWANERQGWSGAWPLNGLGNRVTIEANTGSREESGEVSESVLYGDNLVFCLAFRASRRWDGGWMGR